MEEQIFKEEQDKLEEINEKITEEENNNWRRFKKWQIWTIP